MKDSRFLTVLPSSVYLLIIILSTAHIITIVGDFNANLSRASLFGDRLLIFCDDNTLNIIDTVILPNDAYTYVSYSWSSTSWLDQCTGDIKVVYDCVLSDHHPVAVKIDSNIITACYSEVRNDITQIINWENMSPCALERYKRQTEIGFNFVNNTSRCKMHESQQNLHVNDIGAFYDCIVSVLTECSDGLSNMNSDSHIHDIQSVGMMM